ncbi:hypothetical protein [Flavobacterium sp.]
MDEHNENEKIDQYTKDRFEQGIKALEDEKELKIKWRKEIDSNEELQLYLSQYKPASVETFVIHYVNAKYNVHRHGDMYMKIAEDERSKWIDLAHDHLKFILQKQLFDLQCQWRAEEIKLAGVNKCLDFEIWGQDILNCPFLKPITKEEIIEYQEFLMKATLEYSTHDMDGDWQNYDSIKECYQNDGDQTSVPYWYQYHYLLTGTNHILSLPDIRGPKEDFYRKIYFSSKEKESEQKKIKNKENNEPIPLVDHRPFLSGMDQNVTDYIFEKYEDSQMQKKRQYYTQGMEEGSDNSYYEDMFRELLETNEDVPVGTNYSIRDAIQLAYHQYMAQKVAEHLPTAHEQYLFNRKMGFVVQGDKFYLMDVDGIYTKSILDGRELNGEPKDFDF